MFTVALYAYKILYTSPHSPKDRPSIIFFTGENLCVWNLVFLFVFRFLFFSSLSFYQNQKRNHVLLARQVGKEEDPILDDNSYYQYTWPVYRKSRSCAIFKSFCLYNNKICWSDFYTELVQGKTTKECKWSLQV